MVHVGEKGSATPEFTPRAGKREERDTTAWPAHSETGLGVSIQGPPPNPPLAQQLLVLQKTRGNRYVARMLQERARGAHVKKAAGATAETEADSGRKSTLDARQLITLAPAGTIGRQEVQKGQSTRPPMVFSADTEIVGMPDMILFPATPLFSKQWPILKPTFKPLASGTFIVDGIPISYNLEGQASASSLANLTFGPGSLKDIRVIVTGAEAERMRTPKTPIIIPPILPILPIPLIVPRAPDRTPHGSFSADANLQFRASAGAGAAAYARLDAGLGVFGNALNAGAFAGLSGSATATATTNIDTFVTFKWTDGAVSLSTTLDIDTAISLAIRLSAFAGVWVELKIPEIPVVTNLTHKVQDWPLIGWVVPDLSKWKWRKEYQKDWPLLNKNYKWNLTQRFAIAGGSQTGSFPEESGFDMEKVLRELEGQQKAGELKDDPKGAGTEKRNSDTGAVSSARAAALAQIGSAKRAAEREKKANSRLLSAAKKAAAAAKKAPATGSAPAPSLAIGSGPADPVAQLEAREKKLDQAVTSTEELRKGSDALNAPATAADGVERNQARSGYESIEKNADALGDAINRNEDVFAVPAGVEPSDAEYEKMQTARRAAYDAFDECSDPTRTEKLWADDQVREAGTDVDLHTYRDAAVVYQGKALKLWNRVQKLEADLEKAREWYERGDYGLGVKVFEELKAAAVTIKGEAASLTKDRPQGDWDTDYAELSEGHLMLKPQYRGDPRGNFYPKDYSSDTQNRMWLKIGGVTTGADGKLYWEFHGKKSPRGDFLWLVNDEKEKPTLDHTQPTVVSHWTTSGSKTDYAPRKSFYDFEGKDVVVLPKTLNSSAGGSEKGRLGPRVTRSFRGSKT